MSKIIRVVVLATALLTSLVAFAASAAAVTWHNTGDTAFTASGGAGTLAVTGVNFVCSGATMTGTAPGASVVGSVYSAATGSFSYSGCALSGISVTWDCGFTMTATSQAAAARPVSGGNMDLLCSVQMYNAEICKIEGQTPITYTNPTAPSLSGQILFPHSATLRTTNGSSGSCILGTGEPMTLTTQSFTINNGTGGPTPHLGPVITRTA